MLDDMSEIIKLEQKQKQVESQRKARQFKVARLTSAFGEDNQQYTDILYHGTDENQILRHFRSQFPANRQPHISEIQTLRASVSLVTPQAKLKMWNWLKEEMEQEEQKKASLKSKVSKALKPKK